MLGAPHISNSARAELCALSNPFKKSNCCRGACKTLISSNHARATSTKQLHLKASTSQHIYTL
jgi:hypothetical protein